MIYFSRPVNHLTTLAHLRHDNLHNLPEALNFFIYVTAASHAGEAHRVAHIRRLPGPLRDYRCHPRCRIECLCL